MNATFGSYPLPQLPIRYLLKPIYRLDVLSGMRCLTTWSRAADTGNYQRGTAFIAEHLAWKNFSVNLLLAPVTALLYPSIERAFQLHLALTTDRRMAATALAIKLYEHDHGRRPTELQELVPEYLDSIPPPGTPLQYRPDGPNPMIYSVSVDGIDSNGAYELKRGEVDWDAIDFPFFLDGVPSPDRD